MPLYVKYRRSQPEKYLFLLSKKKNYRIKVSKKLQFNFEKNLTGAELGLHGFRPFKHLNLSGDFQ